jgi:hypothetical protein
MTNNRGTRFVSVPIRFHLRSVRLNWQIVYDGGATLFAGKCLSGVLLENIDLGDGWELVRRFLSVRVKDEQSIVEFLGAHGNFAMPEEFIRTAHTKRAQTPVRPARLDQDKRSREPAETVFESFLLQGFAAVQDYVRRMLVTGSATLATPWQRGWIERYEIFFADSRSGPEAHLLVSGIFHSILATVQFKLVQGATFRTCARKDCRLPFEVTSRHTRRFCTQYCAHITSLRQRRKLERKSRKQNVTGAILRSGGSNERV